MVGIRACELLIGAHCGVTLAFIFSQRQATFLFGCGWMPRYESLLDGLEIEELREHESIDIKHYLFVDAHDTWWKQGKSYLCRIIDMLHMGYIDEAMFGYEVIERLPDIVAEWVGIYQSRLNK